MSTFKSCSTGRLPSSFHAGSMTQFFLCHRMIKTGDWSIADLIKYLVQVQTTLTATEVERLRMTAAIPKELHEGEKLSENGKPPRYRASELYEPLDVFRELKLPVIDWGTHPKWRSNSEEGQLKSTAF